MMGSSAMVDLEGHCYNCGTFIRPRLTERMLEKLQGDRKGYQGTCSRCGHFPVFFHEKKTGWPKGNKGWGEAQARTRRSTACADLGVGGA